MTLDISIMKGKASLPAWKARVKQNKKVVAEIQGVAAVACVGKFSPRNAAHELAMADVVRAAGLTPVCGHSLSGELNFPRRIATAYYNAAVARIVDGFLTAVEQSLQAAGIRAPLRLLKADGGAVPAALARQEPVQSVLSGPAASVMGILALCPAVAEDACSVLLDVGGTTTDVALFAQGSPVVDRDGMSVRGLQDAALIELFWLCSRGKVQARPGSEFG